MKFGIPNLSCLIFLSFRVYLNKKWTVAGVVSVDKTSTTIGFGGDAAYIVVGASNGKVSVIGNGSE